MGMFQPHSLHSIPIHVPAYPNPLIVTEGLRTDMWMSFIVQLLGGSGFHFQNAFPRKEEAFTFGVTVLASHEDRRYTNLFWSSLSFFSITLKSVLFYGV